ncbi:MAG: aminotransferase class I/II-fold pyridoxal phosphate-dependent enzyme [candidate division KSB1 bacterium]|nr:aminotransferase class I/II-fold pyridoxal phosphate-dependent enzyme [candidate division KSB1 bacterium]
MKLETMLAHHGEDRATYHGAVVPPLFQNSLFTFESWEGIDAAFDDRANAYIYSRGGNPTVRLAEEKIASLAGGERALLFGSGMAAISAALMHVLEPGDHVVAVKNIYGPTNNFLNVYLRRKMHIETTFVSGEDVQEFEAALTSKTKLIYLESPSSAVFSLQDIEAVAVLASANHIRTIIDNSWATPIFQKPLAMGIDLEVHSCSKYLAGHSDLVAGVVIGRERDITDIATCEFELLGGKMAPFEAWLLIRSLRTLPLRMRQHQENALHVARFLEQHAKIRRVHYPGLESHPQYDLGRKQMTGYSGLLSFELATQDLTQIKRFVNSLKLFHIGVSWGGHESLIYAPAISYLKELPLERFSALGLSVSHMRISVGLENAEDLIADLRQSLEMLK